MDFSLSEEQQEFKALARDFAEKEIKPKAAHYDEVGDFPKEILKKAFDVGLMNIHLAEEYGGLGLSSVDGALISEEIGAACTGIGTAMEANTLALAPLMYGASTEMKKRVFPQFIEEFTLACYCVTEPNAGSDVAAVASTAIKKGDKYILNGNKMWITSAGHADWMFVLASSDPARGARGLTGFWVDARSPGVEVGKKENNMGQRASDTRAISFTDVEIPEANVVGREGRGFLLAMGAFDITRPMVAAAAVGLGRAAFEYARDYASERKAFDVPISGHQSVKFMLADMATDVEIGRMLTHKASWLLDIGKSNKLAAAMAKRHAADAAVRIATDAVQIYGGYGFNKEYPVEKLYRDAKIFQIYEGTSQIQRLIIGFEIYKGR
ncbi:MAG: acyl-CoA dehydrogenase family protein [Candidatus Delongbacteria bacterium]|nr:acyl-CoA dehydrogenase family protein [Candidatus Delongbacteria bacterium]